MPREMLATPCFLSATGVVKVLHSQLRMGVKFGARQESLTTGGGNSMTQPPGILPHRIYHKGLILSV